MQKQDVGIIFDFGQNGIRLTHDTIEYFPKLNNKYLEDKNKRYYEFNLKQQPDIKDLRLLEQYLGILSSEGLARANMYAGRLDDDQFKRLKNLADQLGFNRNIYQSKIRSIGRRDQPTGIDPALAADPSIDYEEAMKSLKNESNQTLTRREQLSMIDPALGAGLFSDETDLSLAPRQTSRLRSVGDRSRPTVRIVRPQGYRTAQERSAARRELSKTIIEDDD